MTETASLPPLETVSADGIATSDIPAAVGERVQEALKSSVTPGWWGRITFPAEPAATLFAAQARAYCAVQEPELSFRRQTVSMVDPEDSDNETENPGIVQFRVTVKSANTGRTRR